VEQTELYQLMGVLLSKRVELRRRTVAITDDTGTKLSADSDEQAIELENAEVLDELGREAIEQLGLINLALARIDAGTYGMCTECDREISRERLRVVPWAMRCMRCEGSNGR